uniref:Uncharacterized protein n=1 Tax=Heterosigma akashiwo TaxID=2829 RepID=A0A7S4D6T8_HETAK
MARQSDPENQVNQEDAGKVTDWEETEFDKQNHAATRIQTAARQRQATTRVNNLRQEKEREREALNQQKLEAERQDQAATRIQTTARQRQATTQALNQQKLETERQDQAATRIQTTARQRQATTARYGNTRPPPGSTSSSRRSRARSWTKTSWKQRDSTRLPLTSRPPLGNARPPLGSTTSGRRRRGGKRH